MKSLKNTGAVVLFLLWALAMPIVAQQAPPDKHHGKLRGAVKDLSTQKPLSFATVALPALPDSTVIATVVTADTGTFELGQVPVGSYVVKF